MTTRIFGPRSLQHDATFGTRHRPHSTAPVVVGETFWSNG
jgi:hypothetical protein